MTAAGGERRGKKRFIGEAILCVLCTLVGAFYPTMVDWSKTATEIEVLRSGETLERRSYPFSSVSVVLCNDALQLFIAVCFVSRKDGIRALWADKAVVVKMVPLGFIYAVGELLTLRSVQKGSGPVYIVIANMKLVVAAFMSRAFFGRAHAMPFLHWLELVLISLAAAAYTICEAGALGSQWHWEGAWMALTKSSLVAFSSVFCEHIYKTNKFHVVLTLQAFWGFITIMSLIGFSMAGLGFSSISAELRDDDGARSLFGAGPAHPLCTSAAHAECVAALAGEATCRCLSKRGWDVSTLLTVVADLSNAVSSALVFKRLSAVAKYVCRATSALPMYLFYCALGRSSWDLRIFSIIMFLCAQVSMYTLQRHRAAEEKASPAWTQAYGTPSNDKKL